jgi:hypothetical protein
MEKVRNNSMKYLLLILFLFPLTLKADLLPPNTKWVSHQLKIENIKDLSDYVFFIYPRDENRNKPGNSSVRLDDKGVGSMSGNPYARRNGGPYLYAIEKKLFKDLKDPPQEEWFEKETAGVYKAEIVREIRTISKDDKRTELWTIYKAEIKDKKLKLELINDDKPEIPAKKKERNIKEPTDEEVTEDRINWTFVSAGVAGSLAIGCLVIFLIRRWK